MVAEIGSKVIYHSKIYVIVWIYESGLCEIQKDRTTVLVNLTELTPLE